MSLEPLEQRFHLSITTGIGFDGIDRSALATGAPPDPIVAAGPASLIEAVNTSIAIYEKTPAGESQLREYMPFSDFFSSLGNIGQRMADPVVMYNNITNQFVVGMLDWHEENPGGIRTDSRFDFAISKLTTNGNPSLSSSDWDFFRHNVNDSQTYTLNFADAPKIGYNADGYVISFGMQPGGSGQIDHIALLGIRNNGASAGVRTLTQAGGDFQFAPAAMYDAPPSVPGGPQTPMWFVHDAHGSGGGDSIEVVRLDNPFPAIQTEQPSLIRFSIPEVTDYLKTPSTEQPQNPNPPVIRYVEDKLGTRFYFSSLRTIDGIPHLVSAHAIGVPENPNVAVDTTNADTYAATAAAAIRWYDFELTGGTNSFDGAPELVQQGTVNAEDPTADAYLPSIAIAPDGTIGLNFAQSSRTQDMSMYVTAHRPGDQPGFMSPALLVQPGSDQLRLNQGRAGDYSSLAVDPLTGAFWAVNEYAKLGVPASNWATWIQQFYFNPRVADVTISKAGANQNNNPDYSFSTKTYTYPNSTTPEPVVGNGNQLRTVPVGGADTITICFTEPVVVHQQDLVLIGLGGYVPHIVDPSQTFPADYLRTVARLEGASASTFSVAPDGLSATWKFAAIPRYDQYDIHLSDAVINLSGVPLDGDWSNPKQLFQTVNSATYQNPFISKFPSGDGIPGGSFDFVVSLLHGDLNQNNLVTYVGDVLPAYNNYQSYLSGQLPPGPITWFLGDFNGNGALSWVGDVLPANNLIAVVNLQTLLHPLADLDSDYDVDGDDLLTIQQHLGSSGGYAEGDLDGDGQISGLDLDLAFAQLAGYAPVIDDLFIRVAEEA